MKTLKLILPVLFLSLFLIVSCKKKKTETTPNTSSSTSTLSYYGLLMDVKFDYVASGTIVASGGSSGANFPTGGFFNSSTISEGSMGTNVNVGTVTCNSVNFKADNISSTQCYYRDTTYAIFSSPLVWSVSGGNGIPAFNYTYTATRPSYTGSASLPDTIKLSQNNVINLTGISGADEIVITISNTTGKMKVLSGTATSVSFSPSELSGLSASTSSGFFVDVNKSTIANAGGKDFKFKTCYRIYKSIVVQ